ncbi:hypothetical protein Pmani_006219 [Petrolisthes manimaculis]|uniref:Uncharacterized protein n=1 Tax=Petrolisthes manimaculis TaxID=1843537 RepID=A0AAE1QBB1_9EUCA|nr:hypothetical protein Pmani_006219 [Petrolisthes manimaculis]
MERQRFRQHSHKPSGRANRPEVIAQRAILVGMRDAGMTPSEIAMQKGLDVRTVRKWLQRSDEDGDAVEKWTTSGYDGRR